MRYSGGNLNKVIENHLNKYIYFWDRLTKKGLK